MSDFDGVFGKMYRMWCRLRSCRKLKIECHQLHTDWFCLIISHMLKTMTQSYIRVTYVSFWHKTCVLFKLVILIFLNSVFTYCFQLFDSSIKLNLSSCNYQTFDIIPTISTTRVKSVTGAFLVSKQAATCSITKNRDIKHNSQRKTDRIFSLWGYQFSSA